MRNLKLANTKSVRFRVDNFCVPTQTQRTPRHVIDARANKGFIATAAGLKNSFAKRRLQVTTDTGQWHIPEVESIERIFCFSTKQNNQTVNALMVTTKDDVQFIPLWGKPAPFPLQQRMRFSSFAATNNQIFASNDDGVFVANHSLHFSKISDVYAKQLQIFGERLFILDKDNIIHFSAPLNKADFSPENTLAGSIKLDDNLGSSLSLEEFENNLLIVHEHGLRTLQNAFDPSRFNLSILTRSYEPIIEGSVKALGDTVYFLTRGGLCKYNRRVDLINIEIDVDENSAQSIIFDSKYFLSYCDRVYVIEKFFDSITVHENLGNIRQFERVWTNKSESLAILTDANVIHQISKHTQELPTFPEKKPLQEMTWEEVDLICAYGLERDYFNLGDVKKVNEYDFEIIGFSHDVLSDGTGRASITFGMVGLLSDDKRMDNTNINVNGWVNSELRNGLSLDGFPDGIKIVNKDGVQDKLFVFGVDEVLGGYPHFTVQKGRNYFTRTSRENHLIHFIRINEDGSTGYQIPNQASGICLGFAFGEQTEFIYDDYTDREWESDWFTLGYATIRQFLRRILIKTKTDIDLVVSNTRTSRKIRVTGGCAIQTINVSFKGDAFRVKIVCDSEDADISSLSVVLGF